MLFSVQEMEDDFSFTFGQLLENRNGARRRLLPQRRGEVIRLMGILPES